MSIERKAWAAILLVVVLVAASAGVQLRETEKRKELLSTIQGYQARQEQVLRVTTAGEELLATLPTPVRRLSISGEYLLAETRSGTLHLLAPKGELPEGANAAFASPCTYSYSAAYGSGFAAKRLCGDEATLQLWEESGALKASLPLAPQTALTTDGNELLAVDQETDQGMLLDSTTLTWRSVPGLLGPVAGFSSHPTLGKLLWFVSPDDEVQSIYALERGELFDRSLTLNEQPEGISFRQYIAAPDGAMLYAIYTGSEGIPGEQLLVKEGEPAQVLFSLTERGVSFGGSVVLAPTGSLAAIPVLTTSGEELLFLDRASGNVVATTYGSAFVFTSD
jgi:hypothetical protein